MAVDRLPWWQRGVRWLRAPEPRVPFEQAHAEYRERRRREAETPAYVTTMPICVSALVVITLVILGHWRLAAVAAPATAFVVQSVAMLVDRRRNHGRHDAGG